MMLVTWGNPILGDTVYLDATGKTLVACMSKGGTVTFPLFQHGTGILVEWAAPLLLPTQDQFNETKEARGWIAMLVTSENVSSFQPRKAK